VENVITQTIQKIKEEAKDNEKLLLLNLWRNIPDAFKEFELENFKLGNLWNLLPADTRIPDHSILDHNWLTCAIAGSLPKPAFLKFSIGPIQGFIANAKRTEDYWMGSFLLSYLMSKAIEVIIEEVGPEHLIFPFIKGQPLIDKFLIDTYHLSVKDHPEQRKIPSLSNIIFALLPSDKSKTIADKMKVKVNSSLKEISDSIKERFKGDFDDSNISGIWDVQVNSLIEVYYTIYKWPSSINELKEQYQKVFNFAPKASNTKYENLGTYWQGMYKILDSSFNSRKNLRDFPQLQLKDGLVKCSMCGEREVLHPASVTKSGELTKFWQGIGGKYSDKIDRRGRDKLCAVCFIKRMAGEYYFKESVFEEKESINFPSTSTIAALPFKIKVIQNWVKTFPIVKNYNELLKKLTITKSFNWNLIRHIPLEVLFKLFKNRTNEFQEFADFLAFDGQWIYEESFTKKFLEDNGINYDKEAVDVIKCAIGKIQELTNDKPSKYFAVLAMDGDDMGKWLSGTHKDWPCWKDVFHSRAGKLSDEKAKRNLSPAIHSFISKSLNFFSLRLVRNVIELDYPGKLIYSGGDDVLAFLPLEHVLEAAEKTRFTFSGNLDENRKIDLNHTNGYLVIKEKGSKVVIPTLGNKATMSAGIVIAHKNHDLTDVLRQVRTAEKEAKDIKQKDAFMLKILKHSGEITTCRMHWREDGKRIIQQFKEILESISEDDGLSMSFFSAMAFELMRLSQDVDHNLVNSLLGRQIKQHIHLKRKEDESKEEYRKRKTELHSKIKSALETLFKASENKLDLVLTLRFLSTGGKR